MRPLHPQLPKGARVYLPDEAARKRHVEARLLDVVTRWGYREIVTSTRSEEHTSELQSQSNLVCRLLLEKKKNKISYDKRPSEPSVYSKNARTSSRYHSVL